MTPLVSCLMVTRDRPDLAARAIDCHARQTFTNTELVIVDDGSIDYSPVIDRFGARGAVRYIRIAEKKGRVLGDLRNISIDESQGEWLIQWDDDEWYDERRIEEQLRAATRAGAGASALKWTLMRVGTGHEALSFRADAGIATPGTVMFRRPIARYPSLSRNEDGEFLKALSSELGLAVMPRHHAHLFVRVHHGLNTWERKHFMRRLHRTPAQWPSWILASLVHRDITRHPAFRLTPDEHRVLMQLDDWDAAFPGMESVDHGH